MRALRRVVWVLVFYVVAAAIVLQGGFWLQRVLFLPPLFGRLLVGMVALGIPVAIALAWRYPHLGEPTRDGTGEDAWR